MRDAFGDVQSALVLGGTSDIATATLHLLADGRLRRVVLAGRHPAALQTEAVALRTAGVTTVEVAHFDADDLASHDAFVERVFDPATDFDVVLLAFGVLPDQRRVETDGPAAVAALRTNLVGAVSVAVPVTQRLRAQGHGTLIVLSSVAAERPRRANFIYGAAKAGLDAFCQGLTDALEGSGVSVLVVRPGFVHSRMTSGRPPAPFATTPQVVARVIVGGLARGGSATLWAPPLLRWAMLGLRLLPRPLWRRIGA